MKTSMLLVGAYPDRQVQKKLPWVLWQTVWFPQMKFAPIWHSSLSVKENSYTENHVPEKYSAIQNTNQQIKILWCEYIYVNVIEVIFFMLLGGRRLWIFQVKKKQRTVAKSCIMCTVLLHFSQRELSFFHKWQMCTGCGKSGFLFLVSYCGCEMKCFVDSCRLRKKKLKEGTPRSFTTFFRFLKKTSKITFSHQLLHFTHAKKKHPWDTTFTMCSSIAHKAIIAITCIASAPICLQVTGGVGVACRTHIKNITGHSWV